MALVAQVAATISSVMWRMVMAHLMAWTASVPSSLMRLVVTSSFGSKVMSVTIPGLDLAKSVFQAQGVDAGGHAVLKRRVRRQGILAFFGELPPCLVGMEARSNARHWAGELDALGPDVRLIPRNM